MSDSRGVRLAWLAMVLVGGLAGKAQAQIGSGWTEFTPMKNVQLRGAGARYTNENGIETFSIQPGDERAEMRVENDHRTGAWQFEGWVKVGPGVTGGSVHQVFKFLMIVAYPDNGGELRQHSYQRLNATGITNQWVRVNTIHDADAGRADVYINGTFRGMVRSTSPGPNGWYHKYGIYNSSGTRPVVQWREVKFFRGGKSDPTAPAPDAGPMVGDGGFGPAPSDATVRPEVAGESGFGTGGSAGGNGGSTDGSATGGFGAGGSSPGAGGASSGPNTNVPAPDAASSSGGRGGGAGGRGGGAGGRGGGASNLPADSARRLQLHRWHRAVDFGRPARPRRGRFAGVPLAGPPPPTDRFLVPRPMGDARR